MASEHEEGQSGEPSGSDFDSAEGPDAVSEPAAADNVTEQPRLLAICKVIEILAAEGGRELELDCIREYIVSRVANLILSEELLDQALRTVNSDQAATFEILSILRFVLHDGREEVISTFPRSCMAEVKPLKEKLLKAAEDKVRKAQHPAEDTDDSDTDDIDTDSKASDEGRVDPETQAMQAEIDSLKMQLQEKDKGTTSLEGNLEKPASDDGSVGSKDAIDEDGEGEASVREQKLMAENDAMQNTIVALQTQLQETNDEISSREEIGSPQEGSSDKPTATRQARQEASLQDQKLIEENAAMQDTITTLQTQLQEAKDEILSSKEITSPQEESSAPDNSTAARQARRETSLQEKKLQKEIVEMKNMVATLQAELQEARGGVSTSKRTDGRSTADVAGLSPALAEVSNDGLLDEDDEPVLEHGDEDDDDTASDRVDQPSGGPKTTGDVNTGQIDCPVESDAAVDVGGGRSSPDEVEGDDIQTSSLPLDNAPPSVLIAVHSNTASRKREGQVDQWKNEVSDFVSSLRTTHSDLRTGARPSRPCNLHAYEFPAPLELISLRVRAWAQGNQPLNGVFDIARDMFDFFECNQDVCEKAEGQSKKANQRIPRGYTLGSMMNVLNESIDAVAAQDTHPLVMEAIRVIGAMKTGAAEALVIDDSTLKNLTKEIGLHQPERSLLNVILHLVAVVVAVSNKEVSTIADFGGGTDDDKAHDTAKVKAVFDDLCPDGTWKRCKLSVLLLAIMKFFAGNNLDESRKYRAMEALFIILDERLVRDNKVWEEVDAFSLNGGEPSEKKYFSERAKYANRRRYSALNYALILLLGNQYGDLIEATDKVVLDNKGNQIQLECDSCGSFQLSFLRCSIAHLRTYISDKGRVKQHLFSVSTFRLGKIDDEITIKSINEMLKQSKKRKNHKTDGFRTKKTILTSLDGSDDSTEEAVSLVTRIAAALHM